MQVYRELFIGGQWVKPANTDLIAVINPSSEEPAGAAPMRPSPTWIKLPPQRATPSTKEGFPVSSGPRWTRGAPLRAANRRGG